eukprot:gnl/TRDRNA2_/TRDRNA2_179711_c0_seq1.p1 gnl/TRDRNA2_/TRDRNA2_179711_c0~~gnl/TRDRNA2_/TRDRNA2_179711_c0_seq1.p1  ORF type:complete len:685 (+),score=101.30 gnl/TRDRNA2_/TRDRNA2_179711_c0_seq1:103-2055(+)
MVPVVAKRGLLSLLVLNLEFVAGQYFEVLKSRSPTQCERMQCLSIQSDYCRENLQGFYNLEKGCKDGMICTKCEFGNLTEPTRCVCENPPYSIPAMYGEECNAGRVCQEGQGDCYRPCITFLHSTQCPRSHCRWNTTTYQCEDRPKIPLLVAWTVTMKAFSMYDAEQQAHEIVKRVDGRSFPLGFDQFRKQAHGYRLHGFLLEDVTELESMFLQLDDDRDGDLSMKEYAGLPNVLSMLEGVAKAMYDAQEAPGPAPSTTQAPGSGKEGGYRRLEEGARRVQGIQNGTVSPEACGAQMLYYCSFDSSCKADCRECGWKSATDTTFSTCVRPSTAACHADGGKEYCPSDQLCYPDGDCSGCVDRPIVDHSQHMCLGLWWKEEPSEQWTDWVCRHRHKVGMPCNHDQDCIYGLRRCLDGECQPLQPYNVDHLCEVDEDCPHLNYYCPADPTGGENIYWDQYCRQQKVEGSPCKENRECGPDLLCNTQEPGPRCRRLFSLPVGSPAKEDHLCATGWTDRNSLCAVAAKSKEVGRSCDSDSDCTTTDQTGRFGRCTCKAWWESGDSKYCMPVSGDFENHQEKLRDYLFYRASQCGSFWSEEECLKVHGDEILKLKLAVECEAQQLAEGPYLPPADCGIDDLERFPDPCTQLASLR